MATFRLPEYGPTADVLVNNVRQVCLDLPRRVVAVRSGRHPGILFVSRNQRWCFEATRATPADWMVRVAAAIAGDGDPLITLHGHVEGQQELDLGRTG